MSSTEVTMAEAPITDETFITEITIRPDGRMYVFGLSREVLEVLAELWPDDTGLQQRLDCTRHRTQKAPNTRHRPRFAGS